MLILFILIILFPWRRVHRAYSGCQLISSRISLSLASSFVQSIHIISATCMHYLVLCMQHLKVQTKTCMLRLGCSQDLYYGCFYIFYIGRPVRKRCYSSIRAVLCGNFKLVGLQGVIDVWFMEKFRPINRIKSFYLG